MAVAKPKRQLSLFELLMIVSIISVLAALAIPNFLNKELPPYYYPNIKSNLRTMKSALEYYYLDHNNSYPIMVAVNQMPEYSLKHSESDFPYFFAINPGSDSLHGIIKPEDYLRKYPIDGGTNLPYAYYLYQDRYILYAPGNDLVYNITDPEYILRAETEEDLIQRLSPYAFDPTNGTWSSGDIYALGGIFERPDIINEHTPIGDIQKLR